MREQRTENREQKNARSSCSLFTVHCSPRASRGFTLIELLVVCAIMVVVTAIVLADNNGYGGQVLLQDFAYDLALSIREAQVYGISVERFGSGASSSFNAGYGVYFNDSTPTNATQYELFADVAGTGVYQSSENVPPSPYTINRGYSIYALCAPGGTDVHCTGGTPVSALNIVFIRPEPDAWINASCSLDSSGDESCEGGQPSARIVLRSPRGDLMSVSVESNGQISVDQTSDIAL